MSEEELKKINEALKAKIAALETQVTQTAAETNSIKQQSENVTWLKRIVSILTAYFFCVLTLLVVALIFGGFGNLFRSGSYAEKLSERLNPVVAMSNDCCSVVRVYDQTSFAPSYEELVQNERLKCVSVPLSAIRLDLKFVNEFFAKRGREHIGMLRFRIGLQNNSAVEAAILRDEDVIAYSHIPILADVQVCDISCFRKALYGKVYREYAEEVMHKTGYRLLGPVVVAQAESECLTDEEARLVFQSVCLNAVDMVYDWDRFFNICFLGTWDRNHPWLSMVSLLVLGIAFLAVNSFLRPLVIRLGQGLGKPVKEWLRNLLRG